MIRFIKPISINNFMKKSIALLISFLVIASILTNIAMVSAANPFITFTDFFKDPTDQGAAGIYAKWLFLFLIILLVYSSLTMVNFPEQAMIRFVVAAIVGILSTILISQSEIISILTSYTALGITLAIFFPVLILTFFTFAVAKAASPFGILIQKVMWIIYSVYLFLKVGALLFIRSAYATGYTKFGDWTENTLTVLLGNQTTRATLAVAEKGDNLTLIVLLVVAVAVFVIFVTSNKPLLLWMEREAREADILRDVDTVKRSSAYEKARAEASRAAGRKSTS